MLGLLGPWLSSARSQFSGAVFGGDAVASHHSPATVLAEQAWEYWRAAKVLTAAAVGLWLAAIIRQWAGPRVAVVAFTVMVLCASAAQNLE